MTDTTVSTWDHVRDTYRRKDLRQAMYDEGAIVMGDCLLNLHGDAHRDRRRLENRLFRMDTFRHWELEVLGPTIDAAMGPFIRIGHGDLINIGYRTTMDLTALIAGVDYSVESGDDTERLLGIVRTLSAGATIVHSTRNKDDVRTEVGEALERFDAEYLTPSIERRRDLLMKSTDDDSLPRDVLTTLLRAKDGLGLDHEAIRREIAFYLQAGSHSSANAFTHTVHELFSAGDELVRRAAEDPWFRQRCVHETLRLHPASPVAWRRATEDTEVNGQSCPAGDLVVIELLEGNMDRAVWGDDAAEWNPERIVPEGIAPWGHSFGGGAHACIGAELDGGMDPSQKRADGEHLFGTVAVMVGALLDAGGRPDPQQPPVPDDKSSRPNFSSYPVLFP